jgi:signal transduction histidine kinase
MIREAAIIFVSAALLIGQINDTSKRLAQESKAYCSSTATIKPTPEMIMEKVNDACVLLSNDGRKAFSKFKGNNSSFIFAGTYIWINDMNGTMLMHPINPDIENRKMLNLKDSNGKCFFNEMISICKNKGCGWVEYMWLEPGSGECSLKLSYVKKVICDNNEVVVGCSVYDTEMN